MLRDRGANLYARDINGRNALTQAACWGHTDIVTFLVTECGVDVNAMDNEGWSALHLAAREGRIGVTTLLLSTHGTNIQANATFGTNALMIAAYQDHPDICLSLISLGLDPALENNSGQTALTHYAQWLDAGNQNRDEDEERHPLTDEEKQARVKLLTDARAEYLELQRREECYQRRKDAITFLQGSGFLLTAAQREARKAEEAQVDTHAKLAAIDRSTKEANLKYLTDRVFGEDKGRHLGREIVMML